MQDRHLLDRPSPALGEPRCVADIRVLLGEGPVWVEREQALYWVDIKAPRLFRLAVRDGAVSQWTLPVAICSLAPRQQGGFIAGTKRGFAIFDPGSGLIEPIAELEPHFPSNRMNDGSVDREGRFWAGTMDDAEEQASGSLYRLDHDLTVQMIDSGYRVTNGPAFSPDGRTMYHNDSARRIVYVFDLDSSGAATSRRVLAQFEEEQGYPDGMTVDAEGALWIAFWDGWCVRRLSPDGTTLATIHLPVQRPTSCAFGGHGLNDLYVTSARIGLDEAALAKQPQAGGLFVIEGAGRGIPDALFAG